MAHVAQAEAHDAEGFNEGRVAREFRDERLARGVLHVGDFAEQGHRDNVRHILAAVDGDVERHAQPDEEGGDGKADEERHEHDDGTARTHLLVAERTFHEAHVGFVDGLLESHLLALVEEVGVERLLQGLLALDADALLLLVGSTGNLAREEVLVAAGIVELKLERGDVVLQRGADALAELLELAVHVADHALVLRGVVGEAVAVVEESVVGGNLLVERVVAEVERGNEVAVVGAVVEVVVEELRHVELCFDGEALLACRAGFVHHELGRLLEVNELVALLEVGQLVLHAAQLGGNDADALVDELRRVLCHAVLVLHHVFLVGIVERVEHVVGALFVLFLDGEDNEGGFLVILRHGHLRLEDIGGNGHGHAAHLDHLVFPACVALAADDDELAVGSLHGLSELCLLVGEIVAFEVREAGEQHLRVGKFFHLKVEHHALHALGLFLREGVLEDYLEGALVAVEGHFVEVLLCHVVHVQTKFLHDAHHEALRGNDEDFVFQVVAYAHTVELKQARHVVAAVALEARAVARSARLFDEHHGLPLVDTRLHLLVEPSGHQTDDGGQQEPVPVLQKLVVAKFDQGNELHLFVLVRLVGGFHLSYPV